MRRTEWGGLIARRRGPWRPGDRGHPENVLSQPPEFQQEAKKGERRSVNRLSADSFSTNPRIYLI